MPRLDSLGEIPALGPTVKVVLRSLAATLRRRLRRALSRDERPLRIGVDIRPFYEPLTGVGWYLHHLLAELARREDVELVLFGDARVTDQGPHLHVELPPGSRYATFDLRGVPLSRFSRPLTAGAYVLLIKAEGCDLIFGANYFLPRLMSAVASRRAITVHDLTFRRHPELLQKETLANLEREMQREIARSDAIICVSEATRRDLLELYQADPHRVHAVLSGTNFEERPEANASETPPLPDRYILFVSTIEPRKNLVTLIEAFDLLKSRGEYDGKLVVVGRVGWKAEASLRRMAASRFRDDIVHLDYVTREQLTAAYAKAELFVMPSIYEGFGLPILEAMSHGVPVIASRSSSLPEVGGEAALYFDAADAGELAEKIRRVMSDPALRRGMIDEGRSRVARFRWDRTAEETVKIFRRAAGVA